MRVTIPRPSSDEYDLHKDVPFEWFMRSTHPYSGFEHADDSDVLLT